MMEKLFDVEYLKGDWRVRIEYIVNGEYGGIKIYVMNNLHEMLSFTKAFEGPVSREQAVVVAQRMLRDLGESFRDMAKKVISDMKSDLKYNRKLILGD